MYMCEPVCVILNWILENVHSFKTFIHNSYIWGFNEVACCMNIPTWKKNKPKCIIKYLETL